MVSIGHLNMGLSEIVPLVLGVLGLISAYLQSKTRLPKGARKWLAAFGEEKVQAAIVEAAAAMDTPDGRRQYAVKLLQEIAAKQDIKLPTSIANLLVEYVYQQWLRRQKQDED